ncbi:MAG: DUF1684 domain-containing protein [Janthinobacterium lividum]
MRKILFIGALLAVLGLFYYSWQASPGAVPLAPSPAYAAQVRQARQQKDQAFRTDASSPLDSAERAAFNGLRYYQPAETYRVTARLTRAAVPTPEPLALTSGTKPDAYVRYGTAEFELGGQPQQLLLLQKQGLAAAGELFVPFTDPTNGQQTYAAGRYLDLPLPAPNATELTLDFNAAYSPFCAYNHHYSCPKPPAGNRLSVPVLAGEQAYRP